MINVDQDMLKDFLDESQDRLKDVISLLVSLEKSPEDESIINAIFLPVHTIKGNCAYFGLFRTKDLTHELETTLDLIRKKTLKANSNIISVLIAGIEYLEGIFRRLQRNEPEILSEDKYVVLYEQVKGITNQGVPDYIKVLVSIADSIKEAQSLTVDPNQCHAKLDQILQAINKTVQSSNKPGMQDITVIDEFRDLEVLLKMHCKAVVETEDFRQIGRYLQLLVDSELPQAAKKVFQENLENYNVMTNALGYDELLHSLIGDSIAQMHDSFHIVTKSEKAAEANKAQKPEKKEEPNKSGNANHAEHAVEESKTTRVAEKTIDGFLANIGELILVREMFDYFLKKTADSFKDLTIRNELRRLNDVFMEVTNELETSVMKIRKQPVKKIFQRISKLVRDVSKINGKDVDVEIIGSEIEIDKSLIELLDAPIMHMVRNSVDHGIETPEERKVKNKEVKGRLLVSMEESEDTLRVTIQDDGKGLDTKRIFAKAVSMGIVKETDVLTEEEKMYLIFHPGLSTADKVSDISGRGVGMDVVKTDIEKANGKIKLSSTLGFGSTFIIELPKSVMTQIIQGFIVRVAKSEYIIPIYKIVESFPCAPEDITVMKDKDYFVKRHGNIVPIIELKELYNHESMKGDFQNGIFIFIEEHNRKLALFVDQLLGIQQVVVKPLSGIVLKKNLFTGGALMGDGHIALVVNTDYFFNEYK